MNPPPRQYFTKKELLTQFMEQEGNCYCGCGGKLVPGNFIEEHDPPLALRDETASGKPDYLLLKECAGTKTNGPKHTSYGGDRHAIDKAKRLAGETGQNKRKYNWPSQKLPSRPFPKRVKSE